MNPDISYYFPNGSYWMNDIVRSISIFFPRILAAILILIVGATIARGIKRVVVRILEGLRVSEVIAKTPVEHFLKNAELKKAEEVAGSVIYWLLMLVVLHTTVAVLGLEPLTLVLDRILTYIPNVFSAILVLFFGLLLAGVVESLVKGSIRSIDGRSARFLGKVSSYLVMTIAILAAISELGIAKDFILIIFVGFVTMLALGMGLAVGLGGQDLVRKLLNDWYERSLKDLNKK